MCGGKLTKNYEQKKEFLYGTLLYLIMNKNISFLDISFFRIQEPTVS